MPKVSFLSLVSSDGALYNIDPTTVKVKRRIQLANISRLSASLLSDNFFVVHVPLEYDYLFVSGRKTEIISVLRHRPSQRPPAKNSLLPCRTCMQ